MNREGPDGIGYLDEDWNPVVGCTNGCSYCWARRQAKRQKHNCPKCYDFVPHLHPERLDEPLRKRKPSVIGVAFMGDLFDPTLDEGAPQRRSDAGVVLDVVAGVPRHTFVVLTKQPRIAARVLGGRFEPPFAPMPNLVLGVSVEDQPTADERMPHLMKLAAAGWRTFVSIEPMLGPVNMARWLPLPDEDGHCFRCGCEWDPDGVGSHECPPGFSRLDGVILGGQTGPGAVPMHPDWVRKVRDDCAAEPVPFFFKQWGEWVPRSHWPRGEHRIGDLRWGTLTKDGEWFEVTTPWNGHDDDGSGEAVMVRVGRKRAGRRLDGRTHDEVAWERKR